MCLTLFPDLADYIYEHSSDLALDLNGFFIADRE